MAKVYMVRRQLPSGDITDGWVQEGHVFSIICPVGGLPSAQTVEELTESESGGIGIPARIRDLLDGYYPITSITSEEV